MPQDNPDYALQLRAWRAQQNPAPALGDIAAACGVTPQSVSAWLHGESRPQSAVLLPLVRALGRPESDVITLAALLVRDAEDRP